MPDIALQSRILLSEHTVDYRANLQFCCDHYRSVSEVCRRLRLNRQQFSRYLAGTAAPSRHNHKLISDFFGLETHELFMPHAAFAASFMRRRCGPEEPAASPRLAALLRAITTGQGSQALSEYRGFYFKYFYTYLGTPRIKRELVHWYERDGALVSSVKQRFLGEDETSEASPHFITYRGVVGTLGDRLINIDHHRGSECEVSTMILYPRGRMRKRLNGLTLGVSHGPTRLIAAARVVMDFLGTEIDIRAAMVQLGTFGVDDPSVPAAIKHAVRNGMAAEDTLFTATGLMTFGTRREPGQERPSEISPASSSLDR